MSWSRFWCVIALTGFATSCGGGSGTPDAEADASDDSAVDTAAPVDVGAPCTEDAECSDGLFCTGVELCVDDVCEAGEVVRCDDGVDCTTDVCSESAGACVSTAPDEDGDGHGEATCLDADGSTLGDDCDDSDGNRFPGNFEVCDEGGHDEDCDPSTFGDEDRDGDGFLDARCCNPDGAFTICGDDCDDLVASIHPGATEVCDTFDNDCDSMADEGVALDGFADMDRDGHGDPGAPLRRCAGAVGFSADDTDCDDDNPGVFEGQLEFCDLLDNDCDGTTDETPAPITWYADLDGDGFGSPASGTLESCEVVADMVLLSTDCDDADAAINPSAAELCDGRDNDCNGLLDFSLGINDFEDDDGDGLVDIACAPLGTDCDDEDPLTGGGAVERCDGRDNDCDERVDEGAMDRQWLLDEDSDGFGSIASGSIVSCSPVPGYTGRGGDCDDGDSARFPGATESCDGSDQDCDSSVDEAPASSMCALPSSMAVCVVGACTVRECLPSFGDCDDIDSNGCEQRLDTVDHCGRCDKPCAAPGAVSACTAGVCTITRCIPGFGDCNSNPMDGCETRLDNHSDCGACGNSCDLVGAETQCVAGTCTTTRCFPGLGDCNGDLAMAGSDGCETDIQLDLANCGACGNVCVFTSGTGTCNAGACQINSCDPGFSDCDGFSSNGCETDTATDPNNCGSCGLMCGAPGTTAGCAGGECTVGTCMPGFENCNGMFGDGCEADTTIDPNNCGGCGVSCNFANMNPNCDAGACIPGTCFGGTNDCDGLVTTGCESDPQFDIMNCGGCGTVCTAPSGIPGCDTGMCTLLGCDGSNQDCDGVPENGCESNPQDDPRNCGSCGIDCGVGGTCEMGMCQRMRDVSVGGTHSCAVGEDAKVFCWGANDQGQLGTGDNTPSNVPTPTTIPDVLVLSTGGAFSCAVLAGTGIVQCWGDNDSGQLGDGTTIDSTLPATVTIGGGFIDVTAGRDHACAINAIEELWCWGSDASGQLGDGAATTGPGPVRVLAAPTGFRRVVAGNTHTCAEGNDGRVYCWGGNGVGQLGDSTISPSTVPVQAVGTEVWGDMNHMSAGGDHTCVSRSVGGGSMHCWGDNTNQQLTSSLGNPTAMPSAVTTLTFVGEVFAGGGHGCGMGGPDAYCWGSNTGDRLGVEAAGDPVGVPTRLDGRPRIDRLPRDGSVGDHTCALANGSVYCWGDNANGQVGNGATGGTVIAPALVFGPPVL